MQWWAMPTLPNWLCLLEPIRIYRKQNRVGNKAKRSVEDVNINLAVEIVILPGFFRFLHGCFCSRIRWWRFFFRMRHDSGTAANNKNEAQNDCSKSQSAHISSLKHRGMTKINHAAASRSLGFDLYPFDAAEHRSLHWVKQLLFERSEFIFAPMKARSAGDPRSGQIVGWTFLWFVSFGHSKKMNT